MTDSTKRNQNPKDAAAQAEGRINLALIPPAAMAHEAVAYMEGIEKYNRPFNWREDAISAMEYLGACERHIQKFKDRVFEGDIDPGTFTHELGAARACLGIILDAQEHGKLIDDRPPRGNIAGLLSTLSERVRERRRRKRQADNLKALSSITIAFNGPPDTN